MFQRRSLIAVGGAGGRMTRMARDDRASSRPQRILKALS